jgi:restriction system protein
MAIPDYQTIMLPLLKYLSDVKEHHIRETIDALALQFGLTSEERKELLPSGQQYTFDNRVGWARTYMKKAGLIESTRRGYFKITEKGLKVLDEVPEEINVRFLKKFPEFVEFQTLKREKNEEEKERETAEKDLLTPEGSIESSYQRLRQNLAADLIQQVKNCSPSFF